MSLGKNQEKYGYIKGDNFTIDYSERLIRTLKNKIYKYIT